MILHLSSPRSPGPLVLNTSTTENELAIPEAVTKIVARLTISSMYIEIAPGYHFLAAPRGDQLKIKIKVAPIINNSLKAAHYDFRVDPNYNDWVVSPLVNERLCVVSFFGMSSTVRQPQLKGVIVDLVTQTMVVPGLGLTERIVTDQLKPNSVYETDLSRKVTIDDQCQFSAMDEGNLFYIYLVDGVVRVATNRVADWSRSRWPSGLPDSKNKFFPELYAESGGPAPESFFTPGAKYSPFVYAVFVCHPDSTLADQFPQQGVRLVTRQYAYDVDLFLRNNPSIKASEVEREPYANAPQLPPPQKLTLAQVNQQLRQGRYTGKAVPQFMGGAVYLNKYLPVTYPDAHEEEVLTASYQICSNDYMWRLEHRMVDGRVSASIRQCLLAGLQADMLSTFLKFEPIPKSRLAELVSAQVPVCEWGLVTTEREMTTRELKYNAWMCYLVAASPRFKTVLLDMSDVDPELIEEVTDKIIDVLNNRFLSGTGSKYLDIPLIDTLVAKPLYPYNSEQLSRLDLSEVAPKIRLQVGRQPTAKLTELLAQLK